MSIRYSPRAREALTGRIEASRLFGNPADPSTWLVLTPDQARQVENRPDDELAALAPYRLDPDRAEREN